MRLRNVKNAKEKVEKSQYIINNPSKYKGKFSSLFKNQNPINIEIGMGKGDFIINMARKYPNINFIGIEKYESVIVRAIEKLENESITNLKLICIDAFGLRDIFDKEVNIIYLNFSDPWPKNRHKKRRLTSSVFLNIYDNIFKGIPHIIMKTDNIGLFAYSIESLSQHGFTFNKVSLDLENTEIDNVKTEYETKFVSMGIKINYFDASNYSKGISDGIR